jgi:hypothetical protein
MSSDVGATKSKVDDLDERLARVETRVDDIDRRVASIETRVDRLLRRSSSSAGGSPSPPGAGGGAGGPLLAGKTITAVLASNDPPLAFFSGGWQGVEVEIARAYAALLGAHAVFAPRAFGSAARFANGYAFTVGSASDPTVNGFVAAGWKGVPLDPCLVTNRPSLAGYRIVLSPRLGTSAILARSYSAVAQLDPAACKRWAVTIAGR